MGLKDRDYMKKRRAAHEKVEINTQKAPNSIKSKTTYPNLKVKPSSLKILNATAVTIISLIVAWHWKDDIYRQMQELKKKTEFKPQSLMPRFISNEVQERKKEKAWEKIVRCNSEDKECKTTYSN